MGKCAENEKKILRNVRAKVWTGEGDTAVSASRSVKKEGRMSGPLPDAGPETILKAEKRRP